MTTSRRAILAVALAAAFAAPPAAAQDRELKLSPLRDGLVLGAGAVAWVVPESFKSTFAPAACRWCERQPDGTVDVNAFDRAGRNAMEGALGLSPPAWAKTTDILVFGALPAAAVALDFFLASKMKLDRAFLTDVVVIAQSVALSGAINQAFKFPIGRERPFVAYDSPWADNGLRHGTETSADDNLSFYSGHSAAALSTTVAAARILQIRTGKTIGYYTLVPAGVVAAVGRMAADKHWASDVLVGMAMGALVGWLVPTLHAP